MDNNIYEKLLLNFIKKLYELDVSIHPGGYPTRPQLDLKGKRQMSKPCQYTDIFIA